MISVKYQVLSFQIILSIFSKVHSLWNLGKVQNLSHLQFPLSHHHFNPKTSKYHNRHGYADNNFHVNTQPPQPCNPKIPCRQPYKCHHPTENHIYNLNRHGYREPENRRVCWTMFACCIEDIPPSRHEFSTPPSPTIKPRPPPTRPTKHTPPPKRPPSTQRTSIPTYEHTPVIITKPETTTPLCVSQTPPTPPPIESLTTPPIPPPIFVTTPPAQYGTTPSKCVGSCNIYSFEQNLIYFILLANKEKAEECSSTTMKPESTTNAQESTTGRLESTTTERTTTTKVSNVSREEDALVDDSTDQLPVDDSSVPDSITEGSEEGSENDDQPTSNEENEEESTTENEPTISPEET